MRSPKKSRPWGSNFPNMKGKKVVGLQCMCCDARNEKEEKIEKEAKKEIEEALKENINEV